MVANKGIICTKIGCRFDEKHQMRQPLHVNVVRLVNFQGAYSPRQVKRLLAVDQTTRYTGSFDFGTK